MSTINIESYKMLLETLRISIVLDYSISHKGKVMAIVNTKVEINCILKAKINKMQLLFKS